MLDIQAKTGATHETILFLINQDFTHKGIESSQLHVCKFSRSFSNILRQRMHSYLACVLETLIHV